MTRALTLIGAELETTTRKVERPCIGLCYLAKIGAVPSSTPPPLPELEAEVEGVEYEEAWSLGTMKRSWTRIMLAAMSLYKEAIICVTIFHLNHIENKHYSTGTGLAIFD